MATKKGGGLKRCKGNIFQTPRGCTARCFFQKKTVLRKLANSLIGLDLIWVSWLICFMVFDIYIYMYIFATYISIIFYLPLQVYINDLCLICWCFKTNRFKTGCFSQGHPPSRSIHPSHPNYEDWCQRVVGLEREAWCLRTKSYPVPQRR